ncbi:uncharacterized protein LOC131857421 [Cryptomeria japonica]|uniref:uncharacterized protein LOC131857421 n=1 Tax=Cryptomeria japonica TaxID=3369 RepID=UPI0027DA208D|nr:uncharacterized protein LOC131857421 [Cryptomeria japonica]
MEVQHDLYFNQASIVAEACVQCFKIRNTTRRVTIGDVQGVHDEGVSLWKTIFSQQKEVEEEIEKGTIQDQGVDALDKGKGNVVSDISNLKRDVEQPNKHKSTVESFDIDVTLVKGADKTKHPGEDKVIVEDIPYEDKPHRTLVTINPTDNEPLLSEKGAEEGNPKVKNSSIPPIEESEKKETKEKEQKEMEVEKKEEEMKEIEETKESKYERRKRIFHPVNLKMARK